MKKSSKIGTLCVLLAVFLCSCSKNNAPRSTYWGTKTISFIDTRSPVVTNKGQHVVYYEEVLSRPVQITVGTTSK